MLFQVLAGIQTSKRILVSLEKEIFDHKKCEEIKKLRIEIMSVEEAIRNIEIDIIPPY